MSHQLEEVILQPPQDLVPQLIGNIEKIYHIIILYNERISYTRIINIMFV